MTRVTATQFQQNVGLYFQKAQQGEEILIERKRPKANFKLQYTEDFEEEKELSAQDVLDKVQNLGIDFGDYKSGLDYQNAVRR
jgi:hypothetical protein